MEPIVLVQRLLLSALFGLLIGIERERRAAKKSQIVSFGGIRTYPLIAIFGAVSAFFGSTTNNIYVFPSAFLILGALVVMSYAFYSFKKKQTGLTSEISALATFFIGASTFYLPLFFSIVVTILVTLLLSLKESLHKFSRSMWQEEFYAVIKFVVITFIVLPLLPNETIDPWGLFNPYKTWYLAVIISAISFAGYVLVKFIGPERGIYSTGFIGGIVSSTSICSLFAKRARENKAVLIEYRNGALVSYISSIIKVAFVIYILNKGLFREIAPALASFIGFGLVLSSILIFKSISKGTVKKHDVALRNPFTITFALEFALLMTVVFVLAQLAQKYLGEAGIYIISFLSGLAKIDAITVSMSQLAGKSVLIDVAARAVMIGVFCSGLSKSVYAGIFGGKEFARALAPYLIVVGAVGLIVSMI